MVIMDSMPSSNLLAPPPPQAEPAAPRPPLVPERSDFLDGDAPASEKVGAFLARALEATGSAADQAAAALAGPLDRGRPQKRSSGRSAGIRRAAGRLLA